MATRIGTLVDDKSGDTLYPITTVDAVAGSVKDVTVGGVSVVDDGVAEIPAASASALAIDLTPTANSQNLVTSGGVKSYVDGAIPTVPTIDTSIDNASSNTDTAGAKAVYDTVHPATVSSQPSGGMLPNVLYKLGTLTGTVTISFAAASDANIENEYKFTFTAGSTAPTITWPNAITGWAGNCLENGVPVIADDCSYEVSILEGLAIIVEVA